LAGISPVATSCRLAFASCLCLVLAAQRSAAFEKLQFCPAGTYMTPEVRVLRETMLATWWKLLTGEHGYVEQTPAFSHLRGLWEDENPNSAGNLRHTVYEDPHWPKPPRCKDRCNFQMQEDVFLNGRFFEREKTRLVHPETIVHPFLVPYERLQIARGERSQIKRLSVSYKKKHYIATQSPGGLYRLGRKDNPVTRMTLPGAECHYDPDSLEEVYRTFEVEPIPSSCTSFSV